MKIASFISCGGKVQSNGSLKSILFGRSEILDRNANIYVLDQSQNGYQCTHKYLVILQK